MVAPSPPSVDRLPNGYAWPCSMTVSVPVSSFSSCPRRAVRPRFCSVVLVVAAVAFYGGAITGSAAGFAAGLLLDLLTGATMGASSLVLTAVGYAVGRFRELRDPSHGLLPIAVGAAATAGWVLGFAAVSLMLDIGARVSPLVIRDMIVTILLNALLALPVFTGVRKLLRPSLAVALSA